MNQELLRKNFENHGFAVSFFSTSKEAASYLAQQIQNTTVGFGGSMTLEEMGLYEILSQENQVFWHWKDQSGETRKRAGEAAVYMCSANGVSEKGQLVNIDGSGNRVASTLYGHERVYFVVGRNKIEPDMHRALHRAKNVAAPKNAVRLQLGTPCAANGGDKCYDCSSPQRICKGTVILERPCNGTRAEVVFVDEELGY